MLWADSEDYAMNLRRALFIAAFVLPTAAGPALAQVQPRQAPANPFDQPPQQQDEPPCMKDFAKLRDEVEKHGGGRDGGAEGESAAARSLQIADRFRRLARKDARLTPRRMKPGAAFRPS